MFQDIGKFVGRYFQTLVWLDIASIVVNWIFFHTGYFDCSFMVLYWAAPYLIKHRPAARKWTIGVCGLLLAGLVAIFVYAVMGGTQGMFVELLGKKIEHPSLWQVGVVLSMVGVLVAIPLILLLTPQARREFQPPVCEA